MLLLCENVTLLRMTLQDILFLYIPNMSVFEPVLFHSNQRGVRMPSTVLVELGL